jgi:hypothetical protein
VTRVTDPIKTGVLTCTYVYEAIADETMTNERTCEGKTAGLNDGIQLNNGA